MRIKNFIISLTVISVLVAGTAFAAPKNSKDQTQTFESLTPKQVEQWTSLHNEHVKDTRPIRSELRAKRMELRALRNNAKVTPDYISDLTEEIVELENSMEDATKELLTISKEKFNLDFSRAHGNASYCYRGQGDHRGNHMTDGHGGQRMSKGYHSQRRGSGNDTSATAEQKQSM